ncbi:uncharacterized protein LOC142497707 [Ascaphus truei]|uniref:uncharacterized protein LOC142497707 n=1 Tax=Ascaphus truei TaxID=8439 RepID=UPI003F59E2AD
MRCTLTKSKENSNHIKVSLGACKTAGIEMWRCNQLTATTLQMTALTQCGARVGWYWHGPGTQRGSSPAGRQETTLLVDQISDKNDERSATRVKDALQKNHNITASESSIKKMRRRIGWKYGHVRSYPMIRDVNKIKRVVQAQAWIESGETFQDCIFTDKSTVSLERFATFVFHVKGCISMKLHPKCPVKMHVWGAISRRGPGCIVIFDGIMNKVFFSRENSACDCGIHHT